MFSRFILLLPLPPSFPPFSSFFLFYFWQGLTLLPRPASVHITFPPYLPKGWDYSSKLPWLTSAGLLSKTRIWRYGGSLARKPRGSLGTVGQGGTLAFSLILPQSCVSVTCVWQGDSSSPCVVNRVVMPALPHTYTQQEAHWLKTEYSWLTPHCLRGASQATEWQMGYGSIILLLSTDCVFEWWCHKAWATWDPSLSWTWYKI